MDDLAIQLYRVDNPDGIWEIQDPQTRYFYLDKARTMETKAAMKGFLAGLSEEQRRKALEYDGPDGPIG